ncbi:preprotein translocase subunit SecD [bacterium]|nr:preprotein translocase subunit SecD [bacterium]
MKKKLSNLSSLSRTRWIFALVLVFTVIVFLIAGGSYYNKASNWLSEKTNQKVNLPKVVEIPFRLGLDLQGGSHLVYQADVSTIKEGNKTEALEGVRDVVERRVNAFGVGEPVIQINNTASGDYRLIVELAGIKDIDEAISMIGETPLLEFKELKEPEVEIADIEVNSEGEGTVEEDNEIVLNEDGTAEVGINLEEENNIEDQWLNTNLSGKNLKRANVQFNPNDNSPEVSLEFDSEGGDLFAEITDRNVGKPLAIFLDGYIISAPTVNSKITGGQAVINGHFNLEEAKLLAQRLNAGALPVPIELISQKNVGASLGHNSINTSLKAGVLGLILVALFLLIYYRIPGLWAVLSLGVYGLTVLSIFKAIPVFWALILVVLIISLMIYTFHELNVFDGILSVLLIVIGIFLFIYALKPLTLTLSGIAGFILSIGMAVDANVLIFERFKEELRLGKSVKQSIEEGFKRAWPSIRDGNISTIFICLVLMFFASGSVQGFGTTLFIGISVSMFSAIVITRTLMLLGSGNMINKCSWLMGVRKNKISK